MSANAETQRKIYQQHCRGESVESLARRFGRSQASIYRTVKAMRAQRIMGLPLDYVPNPQFDQVWQQEAEQEILGPAPDDDRAAKPQAPAGLPPYLASLYEVPLLTPAQEAHLFRKMNYLKYKASRIRDMVDPLRPQNRLMEQIEQCYAESLAAKNQIIRANLRLVVSLVKQQASSGGNFFELVSDGNMSLIRAADKFDFSRGTKFGTYASWAIIRNFVRSIPQEYRHHGRFRTCHGEVLASVTDDHPDPREQESSQQHNEQHVATILKSLDRRERQIIIRRFGLRHGKEPLTLKQIGREMGVTKERIRQLETRAINKLREACKPWHAV